MNVATKMDQKAYINESLKANEHSIEAQKQIKAFKEKLTNQQDTHKEPVVVDNEVVTKRTTKKLCILGTANLTRHMAPWADPEMTFWGVGHCLLISDIQKLDAVFEIHLPQIYNSEISPYSQKPIIHHGNKELKMFADKEDSLIYLISKDPNINKQAIFPYDYLKEKYMPILPPSDKFYQTNSISWMILLAIDMGYEEIHLYGVHLETDTEWTFERPCCEFWLGFAAGRGIKIYVPPEAPIVKCYHEYGRADIEYERKELLRRLQSYEQRLQESNRQLAVMLHQLNQFQQELKVPIKTKLDFFQNQITLFTNELAKYKEIGDDDKYKVEIDNAVNAKINEVHHHINQMTMTINQLMGGKSEVELSYRKLNA